MGAMDVWTKDVTVEKAWGAVLAIARDRAEMQHRFWFREIDSGIVAFEAEVIEYESPQDPEKVERHYVDVEDMFVPSTVEETLEYHGYNIIVEE